MLDIQERKKEKVDEGAGGERVCEYSNREELENMSQMFEKL